MTVTRFRKNCSGDSTNRNPDSHLPVQLACKN